MLDVISHETPQRKWASSRLEGRTSWIFSSCGRCSRLTTGTSGTRSGGLRKGQSPCELLGGLSGFLSRRCCGLRPCVESVPEPEYSSLVLAWIMGYFWSLPRGVSLRLEWGHARAISSRAVAAVSLFPSRGSRDLWLSLEAFTRGFPKRVSHEAFTRGFPTGLSHVPPWCESILGLKFEAVQGKQVSLNGLRHLGDSGNGDTTLEFLSLFPWRAPALGMQLESRKFIPDDAGTGSHLSS